MEKWTRREVLAASALGAATLAGRIGSAAEVDDKDNDAQKVRPGSAAPSESIVLGFIGVGGMGTGLLNIFKGFPDVARRRGLRRLRAAPPPGQVDGRRQARRLQRLPRGARPQGHRRRRRRHARPLARDPDDPGLPGRQGRLLREAARVPDRRGPGDGRRRPRSTSAITQMGNLIHAGENYHRVVEIVRSGVLGTITKTRVWMAADRSGLGKPGRRRPARPAATTTSGSAPPRSARSTRTGSPSTGAGSGTTPAAS